MNNKIYLYYFIIF